MVTTGVSRRALIKASGAIGASVLPSGLDVHIASAQERHATPAPSNSPTPRPFPSQAQSTTYLFLNTEEAAFIEAMGDDPKTSVVNCYLQCWDVHNVFSIGGSAFPQKNKYLKSPGPLV